MDTELEHLLFLYHNGNEEVLDEIQHIRARLGLPPLAKILHRVNMIEYLVGKFSRTGRIPDPDDEDAEMDIETLEFIMYVTYKKTFNPDLSIEESAEFRVISEEPGYYRGFIPIGNAPVAIYDDTWFMKKTEPQGSVSRKKFPGKTKFTYYGKYDIWTTHLAQWEPDVKQILLSLPDFVQDVVYFPQDENKEEEKKEK